METKKPGFVRKHIDLIIVAVVVFAAYTAASLALAGQVRLGYGLVFAIVADVLYIAARRLLGYLFPGKRVVKKL